MPQKIFTLEALAAKHGDSLLLHWGSAGNPRLMVIDGGPSGVFNAALRKRLERLRNAPGRNPLPIDLLMVSHVDDDHIRGVLDLTRKLEEIDQQGGTLPWEIDDLWHNAFDDVLGKARARAFGAQLPATAFTSRTRDTGATIASVGQGRTLRDRAQRLAIPTNGGDGLIVGGFVWDLGSGLELSVVSPRADQIAEFQKAWDAAVKKNGWATRTAAAEVAAFLDKSPFNLASIVAIARLGSKRILLTGDARGDHILDGLREDGFLTGASMKIDVLKVPHHGSDRNVDTQFFRAVQADHYVISGNGEHGNPDITTLEMILQARGSARFQVHCTYRNGIKGHKQRMKAFLDRLPAAQRKKFKFRPDGDPSLRVHLGASFQA